MTACARCGKDVDESTMYMSERGLVCPHCSFTSEIEAIEGLSLVHPAVIVGGIAGIVPFFVHVVEESPTSYIDYAGVSGGAVAALAGLVFLVMVLRDKTGSAVHYIVSVVMLLLGAFHLLRGFGIF